MVHFLENPNYEMCSANVRKPVNGNYLQLLCGNLFLEAVCLLFSDTASFCVIGIKDFDWDRYTYIPRIAPTDENDCLVASCFAMGRVLFTFLCPDEAVSETLHLGCTFEMTFLWQTSLCRTLVGVIPVSIPSSSLISLKGQKVM